MARLHVKLGLGDRLVEVVEAQDFREASELLEKSTFTLAMVSLTLSGQGGLALVHAIRSCPRTRHLPVVVIAENGDIGALESALEAGANSFMTRPLERSHLRHHVAYLNRSCEDRVRGHRALLEAEAAGRAKNAVFAAVASRMSSRAERILELAGEQIEMLAPHDMASRCLAALSKQIAREAGVIQALLDETMPRMRMMTENVLLEARLNRLSRIVNAALDDVGQLADKTGVGVESAFKCDDILIFCDATALAFALANLLRNAIEASPSGSTIRLQDEQLPDQSLMLSVIDDGHGADPALIARSLSPLDDSESWLSIAKDVPGLGLPIARAIVHAHGGKLELRTMPGLGAHAMIVLPPEILEIEEP